MSVAATVPIASKLAGFQPHSSIAESCPVGARERSVPLWQAVVADREVLVDGVGRVGDSVGGGVERKFDVGVSGQIGKDFGQSKSSRVPAMSARSSSGMSAGSGRSSALGKLSYSCHVPAP